MMRISNKVKHLIKLVNMLLPKYEFDIPMEATVFKYIDISYPLPYANNEPRYVGTILLNRRHSHPFKSTDIVLSLPTDSSSFREKLIKEWKSIGISFEADKTNSNENYYYYYKIWVEDNGNQ